MRIEVLGAGCANCKKVEALVREVVSELGVEARVEHVSDYRSIMSYGVLATPGLVIDGEVRVAGRIPSRAEVVSWIVTTLEKGVAE